MDVSACSTFYKLQVAIHGQKLMVGRIDKPKNTTGRKHTSKKILRSIQLAFRNSLRQMEKSIF